MTFTKEFIMKTARMLCTFLIVICIVFVVGCRKEDSSPVYQYYGPDTITGTDAEDSDREGALSAEGDGTRINYSAVNVTCPIPKGTKGFVTSDTDMDEFWMESCPSGAPEPDINFDRQFLAYYATQLSGCAEIKIKKIGMVDDKIVIGLEKFMPPPTCNCTKNPYTWRAVLAIDQVEDTTPRFVIYAADRECTPVQ